jgi:hypothetical protein
MGECRLGVGNWDLGTPRCSARMLIYVLWDLVALALLYCATFTPRQSGLNRDQTCSELL